LIRHVFENYKWGIETLPEGVQFNFFDEDAGTMVCVPFHQAGIDTLIEELQEKRPSEVLDAEVVE
jgi:hypothetical protein